VTVLLKMTFKSTVVSSNLLREIKHVNRKRIEDVNTWRVAECTERESE